MDYRIRMATAADSVLIADLSRQTFADTFSADNTAEDMELFLAEQFTRGRLMLEVGRPELTFLLLYAGTDVAGYVKLREATPPASAGPGSALEIARLYAATSFIGKGAGRRLMEESIRIAREREKDFLWLGVWEKNQRAIDFYTRFGFKQFDTCTFLLGRDEQTDWLMKKDLKTDREE